MNYGEAVSYLSDKKRILDLEVIEEASRKWQNKKLVINTEETKIPFTVNQGSEIILVLKAIAELLNYQTSIVKTDYPKHVDLVIDFVRTCMKLESIKKAKNKFVASEKLSSDIAKKLDSICANIGKLGYSFKIANLEGIDSIEDMIKINTGRWHSPSLTLMDHYPSVNRISVIKQPKLKNASIVFSKEDVKDIRSFLQALDVQEIDKRISSFLSSIKNFLDTYKKEGAKLDEELSEFNSKYKGKKYDDEISIIGGMVDNIILQSLDEDGDMIVFMRELVKHFQDTVIFLAGLVKETTILVERTDSWFFSKNV